MGKANNHPSLRDTQQSPQKKCLAVYCWRNIGIQVRLARYGARFFGCAGGFAAKSNAGRSKSRPSAAGASQAATLLGPANSHGSDWLGQRAFHKRL